MKNYKCKNGHEFDLTETQGEEWTETEVCPVCKTDDFEPINIDNEQKYALSGFIKLKQTMILTKEQINQLEEASKPLMKFLAENFHPHVKVIVESDSAEFLESSASVKCDDFIVD